MKNIRQPILLLLLLCSALFSKAQVPVYSSYPSAGPVIYLDFDGHYMEGTSWNGSGPINCASANLPPAKITEIYDRVAEDYRPFKVNVTTDSTKYLAAPPTKRMRVVLTTSSSWYGTAGGVSYNYSFSWGDNTPCFVFTALLNYNAKNIAEAASHEVGHTLGLRHQSSYDGLCNKTAEYNAGAGSGEIGWAPIMGVGYYRNLTLWHYGSNPYGCTAYQDDLSIITDSTDGIEFRSDDHGNTTALATTTALVSNQFALNGVIEKPADVDAIKFNLVTSGRFVLSALPYSIGSGNIGSDIDLEVELISSSAIVMGVYNPPTVLNATIDTILGAGVYYLRVQGKGNSFAPNYASLGSYSLQANFTPLVALPVYKLEIKGNEQNGLHNINWEIISREKITSQTIEISTTGANFKPVANVSATDRNFSYTPSVTGTVFYRLLVSFIDGRQYYSSIITLRNSISSKPYLVTNNISNTLTVNSPAAYTYCIYDVAGRAFIKGDLSKGSNVIPVGAMHAGMYIIQYSNGQKQLNEKLFKQ